MMTKWISALSTLTVALIACGLGARGALASEVPQLSFQENKILYQAQKALEVGDPRQAITIIKQYQTQQSGPVPSPFFSLLGSCHYQLKQYREAAQAFGAALNQHPDDGDLSVKLATCLYQACDYIPAGRQFAAAYGRASPPKPDLLYQSAVAFYQGKDCQHAAQSLKKLIKTTVRPENAWMELLLSCRLELKKWSEAESLLNRLLKRQPMHERYWRLLSQLHLQRKQYRKAVMDMEVMYQLSPPSFDDLKNLAGWYSYLNLPLRSARLLRQAYGEHLASAQIKELAGLYQRGFDYQNALATVAQGLKTHPNDAGLQTLRTQLLYEKGDYQALVNEKALMSSTSAQERLLQGYAAWHLGRWTLAQKYFKQALRDAHSRTRAKNALDVLELILQAAEDARSSAEPLGHTTIQP